MKVFLWLFCVNCLFSVAYDLNEVIPEPVDEELITLWESLDNLYEPSFDDYGKISQYLKFGRRAYLDALFDHVLKSDLLARDPRSKGLSDRSNILGYRVLQDIEFVGSGGQPPQFKQICLGGVSLEDREQCIILYATYNKNRALFADKLAKIIEELEEVGYRGHVLVWIGGYPMTQKGGLRFVHIPYSFKILAFIEASQMGYENVLWLDCSIHPANDLSAVFTEISEQGLYLLKSSVNLDFDYRIDLLPDAAIFACDLETDDLPKIGHVMAGVIGISFKHQLSHELIDEWLRLTAKVYPAMSLHPEEFLLSIASWRCCVGTARYFLEQTYNKSEVPVKPVNGVKPFWFDKQ